MVVAQRHVVVASRVRHGNAKNGIGRCCLVEVKGGDADLPGGESSVEVRCPLLSIQRGPDKVGSTSRVCGAIQ